MPIPAHEDASAMVVESFVDVTQAECEPKMMKKRAKLADVAPENKRVKRDPMQEKIDVVCAALADSDRPVPARDMLLTLAPAALSTTQDERSELQASWAGMIGEVFDAELARLKVLVADSNSAAEEGRTEGSRLASVAVQATAALEAKKAELKGKSGHLVDAVAAVRDAASAMGLAGFEKAAAEEQQTEAAEEKKTYDELKQDTFLGLKDGSSDDAEVNRQNTVFLADHLQRVNVDKSLLKALPDALRKHPDNRGTFDIMAVKEVEQSLDEHLAKLDSQIADATAAITEKGAVMVAAEAAQSAALEQKKLAVEVFMAADAERKKLEAALREAQQAITSHQGSVQEVEDAHQVKVQALEHFQEVRSTFGYLRERKAEAEAESVAEVSAE